MKTQNPSLNDIHDIYFHANKCIITLRSGQVLSGVFTHGSIKESGKIKGWYFIEKEGQKPIPVIHDQIELIEKPD